MSLNVVKGTVGTTAAVRMTGVVDWSTLAQFRRALLALVSGPDLKVRLDVAGVVFSSPEARLFLSRYITRARRRGSDVVVSGFAGAPHRDTQACRPTVSDTDDRQDIERRARACHPTAAAGRLKLIRPCEGSRGPSDSGSTQT
jgi:hypothetical protein